MRGLRSKMARSDRYTSSSHCLACHYSPQRMEYRRMRLQCSSRASRRYNHHHSGGGRQTGKGEVSWALRGEGGEGKERSIHMCPRVGGRLCSIDRGQKRGRARRRLEGCLGAWEEGDLVLVLGWRELR
jgi:hypothetical protein